MAACAVTARESWTHPPSAPKLCRSGTPRRHRRTYPLPYRAITRHHVLQRSDTYPRKHSTSVDRSIISPYCSRVQRLTWHAKGSPRRLPHVPDTLLKSADPSDIVIELDTDYPHPTTLVDKPPCPPIHTSRSLFRRTIATISSTTTRTSCDFSKEQDTAGLVHSCASTIATFTGGHTTNTVILPPPVFHTQSLLFLFGFLFFPCWWIGAFVIPQPPVRNVTHKVTSRPPTLVVVHPSMLANGRASSRFMMLWDEQDGRIDPLEHACKHDQERVIFRRWNRYMSYVSFLLLAIIGFMLVWYQYGVHYHWWRPVI